MDKENQEAVRVLKYTHLGCRFLVDALCNIHRLVGDTEDVWPLFAAARSCEDLASQHTAFLVQFNDRQGSDSPAIPKDNGPWDLWDTCHNLSNVIIEYQSNEWRCAFLPLTEVTSILGDIPALTEIPGCCCASYHSYVYRASCELLWNLDDLVFDLWHNRAITTENEGYPKDYDPEHYNIFASRRLDTALLADVTFADIQRVCRKRPDMEYPRLNIAMHIEYLRALRLIETYGVRPSNEHNDMLQAMADEKERSRGVVRESHCETMIDEAIARLHAKGYKHPKKEHIAAETKLRIRDTWATLKNPKYNNCASSPDASS